MTETAARTVPRAHGKFRGFLVYELEGQVSFDAPGKLGKRREMEVGRLRREAWRE